MKLGIRSKFIGILVIASVLPILIAVVATWVVGYHYIKRQRGVLFQAAATHLAVDLGLMVQDRIDELSDWVQISDLADVIREENARLPVLTGDAFGARMHEADTRWLTLKETDPELQLALTNRVARTVQSFQRVCPLYAEIFATNDRGELLGSTGKTSDYWQGDEDWWAKAVALGPLKAYVEGINFDESSHAYSIDVAVPVYDPHRPDEKPVGVVKGVLNTTPVFASLQPIMSDTNISRQLVLDDGRILLSLFGRNTEPLEQHLQADVMQRLRQERPGWLVGRLTEDSERLVGYAQVQFNRPQIDQVVSFGTKPFYMIVHQDLMTVLAPVHRQLRLQVAAGAGILLVFSAVGLFIATRRIIQPVQRLRAAAQAIASTARDRSATTSEVQDVRERLSDIARIRTGDEFQSLAQDFHAMAARLLSYHAVLEQDIAAKTAEIHRDLEVAREFQEALMPRTYPEIRSNGEAGGLRLSFHHIYKPTSSVGGDFFDVLKLSDHRAGIFIADVMGHGARSALVTAILRTLLQDLTKDAEDPALLLAQLNRQFTGIVMQSSQFLFASACYLVIDMKRRIVTYASAGHPAPLIADRRNRTVSSMIERLKDNPVLGLSLDSAYTRFTRFINEGDLFLLFTDGVFETLSPDGEEFGHDRLNRLVEQNLGQDVASLVETVIKNIDSFRGDMALMDDICLVGCEIRAGAGS